MTERDSTSHAAAAGTSGLALSETGRARRDEILRLASATMVSHQRSARRRRQFIAGGTLAAVVMFIGVFAATTTPGEGDKMAAAGGAAAPAVTIEATVNASDRAARSTRAAVSVRLVQTEPAAVARFVMRSPAAVDRLSDEALVQLLASIDRPAGLINMDGQTRLTRNVTDSAAHEDGDRNRPPSS